MRQRAQRVGLKPQPHEHAPPQRRWPRAARARARCRSSQGPITARSPRSNGPSSRTTSSAAGFPAWSPPAASSSASTWARSTWSSRSSRRRRWPAPCSASAGRDTRSVRCRAGCSSPSTGATSFPPQSRSSGCAREASRRCTCRPTRSTYSPSRWWPPPRWRPGRPTPSSTSYAGRQRSPPSPAARTTRRWTCSPVATPVTSSPSCDPRLVWDRVSGELSGRPGAQRLAVTSGGTIPDRGLFGVFLVGEKASRVGELDEEMVYESRVGDVFTLGTTSWRIEDITHDRVLVSPPPGNPAGCPSGPATRSAGRPSSAPRSASSPARSRR